MEADKRRPETRTFYRGPKSRLEGETTSCREIRGNPDYLTY